LGDDQGSLEMAIIKFDIDFKPIKRKIITFSGTVKVEGSFAARMVHLYKESTGELIHQLQAQETLKYSLV
jgi:hypothetical protein